MKRWLLVLLLLSLPAFADDSLPDTQQEARAVAIGEELRCVVCQSESINESQADMARDLRILVREKIGEGWSDQQIMDFAKSRYGDFILLKPPVQANTYVLWALPLLFLAMAAFVVKALFARKKNKT
jgi:cytochrome c-type biogenesis protein CcmH